MKYLILIPDGMADEPIKELGDLTPLAKAKKANMDMLAARAEVGTVSNVPSGMVPESDTANMAILSFDPKIFSKGRSPLEAASMGIEMMPDETAYRCNVVTLTEDQDNYEDRVILDHSADEITTEEADKLIKTLEEKLGTDLRKFYTGISYRHCLIWKNSDDKYNFMRPHDILGKRIGEYLPKESDGGKQFLDLMKQSYDILKDHPVNIDRKARGLKPANSIWLWSPGKKPQLPSFKEKWGLDAAVISAVDLIKGIGLCAEMKSIPELLLFTTTSEDLLQNYRLSNLLARMRGQRATILFSLLLTSRKTAISTSISLLPTGITPTFPCILLF